MTSRRRFDWLIVGAGLTGSTFAELIARELDQKVLIIDRRDHVAGNAHDCRDTDGIMYHKYGPHIFHTNADKVAAYLSRFTEWVRYEHRVLAEIDERLVPMPFNLTSLKMCFEPERARTMEKLLVDKYGKGARIPILAMREENDPDLRELSRFIFDKAFLGYTLKQWGVPPEALSASVTGRVPIVIGTDDRYFVDHFQFMPKNGFTAMVDKMLDHPNITVELNTDWDQVRHAVAYDKVLFTGPIDGFFDYCFGALPYRSIRFDFETKDGAKIQPAAVVNYPNRHDYTRITEMGYLTQEWGDKTKLAIEYPEACIPGKNEPSYPIPRPENQALYDRYRDFADREAPHILFAGRLGDYQYYNMDQAVARAHALFRKAVLDAR